MRSYAGQGRSGVDLGNTVIAVSRTGGSQVPRVAVQVADLQPSKAAARARRAGNPGVAFAAPGQEGQPSRSAATSRFQMDASMPLLRPSCCAMRKIGSSPARRWAK